MSVPAYPLVPLTFPYWFELVTRVIKQDLGVLLERYELGWVRHALCPLNVPHEGLDTPTLCAAETTRRLLQRPSANPTEELIAHVTAAGFLKINGYLLRIPPHAIRDYRSLLSLARDGRASTEDVARFLAAFSERDPGYERPAVRRPSGLILLTSPVLEESTDRVKAWYEPLRSAVRKAGASFDLDLDVACPALIRHHDPQRTRESRRELLPRLDGQLVVGLKGATTGGGHEQILLGLSRPWCWLQVEDAEVSTSVRAWALVTPGSIEQVDTPEEGEAIAEAWVASEWRRVAMSIYRRETSIVVSYRIHMQMLRTWIAAGADRAAIAEVAGVSEELISYILGGTGVFDRIPPETIEPIAAAMGIAHDTAAAPRQSGMLERNEETALDEYVIATKRDGHTALRLRDAGAQLSAVDRRRLGLGMPEGWEIFHRGLPS